MKGVTNRNHLSNIEIDGYKSIAKCDLQMGCLNVLIGANGAGKSTLLKAIVGLIPSQRGQLRFNGTDLRGSSPPRCLDLGIILRG